RPDLRPHPPHLDPADALQPLPARHGRLHRGGHRSVSERVPALHPAARWRGLRARSQPDARDGAALCGGLDRRRRDSRVSSPRTRAEIAGWRRALGVCGAVVLVDQASKAIITSSIAVNHDESLVLGFKLTNTSNTGLAFGIG